MSSFSEFDHAMMARALRLAALGRYSARPNPMVGCVLVKNGDVIGEGWHRRAGEAHAEVVALQAAGERSRGATAYVTLEPCSHHGRTPPCADALIEAGVAKIIVAMRDPSAHVNGDGITRLRQAGIDVAVGCQEAAAASLNRGFVSRAVRGRPIARLKLAMSLDGATAMASGESQWITGPAARADVQRLRAESGAVMTGIGTVLSDDPSLTVRDETYDIPGQPLRVVLDSTLKTPKDAKMIGLPGETLIFSVAKGEGPPGAGVVSVAADPHGRVDVAAVYAGLAERGINDLLIECGAELAGALLAGNWVDELVIYQSPHMMGSVTRRSADTPAWTMLTDRLSLDITDSRFVGPDHRITATIVDE